MERERECGEVDGSLRKMERKREREREKEKWGGEVVPLHGE